MKIRTDYVSNSSSSSFVFQHSRLLEHFNIKKDDIVNAIRDLLPEEEKKFFDVYDLNDKKDKRRARRWKSLLEGWESSMTIYDEKRCQLYGGSYAKCMFMEWQQFISVMEQVFDFRNTWDIIHASDKKKPMARHIRSDDDGYNVSVEEEELPDYVVKTVQEVRRKKGIMFNWDIVLLGISQYLIHFSENTVLTMDGVNKDNKKKYKTDSYSMERVCEVLVNYFIKNGKIDPNDQYILDQKKKDKSYQIYKELADDILTCCMHEG